MNSKDITLWIDERWYDALNRHLKDETLEEHLEKTIDEMCRQLPGQEYERILTLQKNRSSAPPLWTWRSFSGSVARS